MTQIKKVKTQEGVQFYPQTHTKAVIDDNGNTTESRLGAMQDEINQAQLEVGAVPSDLAPTENSSNWVTSGGVYNSIQVVQSELTELENDLSVGVEEFFELAAQRASLGTNMSSDQVSDRNVTTTRSGGMAKWTFKANSSNTYLLWITLPTLVVGKKYTMSFKLDNSSGSTLSVHIRNSSRVVVESIGSGYVTGSEYTVTHTFVYSSDMYIFGVAAKPISGNYISIYDISVKEQMSIKEEVDECQQNIAEIEDTLGGDYLGTDMLEQGGVNNNNGGNATESTNVRTIYLPLGDATSVIIYNYDGKSVDDHTLYFKYMWYDANKVYKGYQTWTPATTAQVPSGAVGGYVRIVFSRNPSATTTPSNIAQFELFLNIYGHDTLVKRVEALEAKEEDDDTSTTAQIIKCIAPDTITFCTWNIGHFDFGRGKSSSITGEDYDTKLAQFRDLIYNTINPRVIALNEYSAVFGKDSNNVSHNARDVLFNDFLIKYEGSQSNYSCNAMFASTYLVNMKMQRFDCLPHETIAGGYQDDYYYIVSDLYLEGRMVKLISTHFVNTKWAEQAAELVNKFADYDRVVVAGDLNTSGGNNFTAFTEHGYTVGNTSINTYKVPNPTLPLDHIIYKGVSVSNIRAITSSLSDHYPLVCTITV